MVRDEPQQPLAPPSPLPSITTACNMIPAVGSSRSGRGAQGAVAGGAQVVLSIDGAQQVRRPHPADRIDDDVPVLGRVQVQCDTQRGAQDVVVIDQGLQRGLETLVVDVGREPNQHRLREAVERAVLLQHCRGDRGERHGADTAAGQFGQHRRGVLARDRGECGNGLAFEHVPGREHQPGRLGARDKLDRGDAVAAEREEAVVGAHLGHAEDLAEQRRESALGVGVGHAGEPAANGEIRCRQGLAVEFADRCEGQRVQHGDRGGHHVAGQEFADVSPQCRRVDGGTRPGKHVGGQRGRTGGGPGPDGGGERDSVVLLKPRVDLAELDPQAADLHLEVAAAEIFHNSGRSGACGATSRLGRSGACGATRRHVQRTRSPVRYIRIPEP